MKDRESITIKITILFLLMTALFSTTTCEKSKNTGNGKLKIITTLFPQYDFARQITGDNADVRLLLPPGVESHSYEPTPRDIVDITKAAIFIYTGNQMEPWVEKIADRSGEGGVLVIDAGKGVELAHGNEHHEGEEVHSDDDHHGGIDPHIWTDPLNAKIMVDNIVRGLAVSDPAHAQLYRDNGEAYKKKLDELDALNRDVASKVKVKTILYAGHFAFGYYARQYGYEYLSPYSGFSADTEPMPQRIAGLIEKMKELGLTTIFYEELIDPKAARVIANQTGAEMVLLHAAHNVSKKELENGVTYIEIMSENCEKLKKALGYHE